LGAKWQYERLEDCLKQLDARVQTLESRGITVKLEETEEAYDFVVSAFDHVCRVRSRNKRRYFANLLTRQFVKHLEWDEAESAMRLLKDLTEIHIFILQWAVTLKPFDEGPFRGLRIISLPAKFNYPNKWERNELIQFFPRFTVAYLRLLSSELVGKGLLHDEGIGRFDISAMEELRPTSLADWFVKWLYEYSDDHNNIETHPPVIRDFNTPPDSPKTGERYGILDKPTGEWAEHLNGIAEWDGKRWIFTDAEEGMVVFNEKEDKAFRFKDGEWVEI